LLPRDNQALRFFGLFALFFVVYNIPAPGLGRTVSTVASLLGETALSAFTSSDGLALHLGTAAEVRGHDPSSPDEAWTVVLDARNPEGGGQTRVNINLRRTFYLPIAVFLALALASPIWSRGRGLVVLLSGLGLLLLQGALWVLVPTIALFYEGGILDLAGWAQGALRFAYALIAPPGVVYALPLLTWAVLVWATRPLESDPLPTNLAGGAATA